MKSQPRRREEMMDGLSGSRMETSFRSLGRNQEMLSLAMAIITAAWEFTGQRSEDQQIIGAIPEAAQCYIVCGDSHDLFGTPLIWLRPLTTLCRMPSNIKSSRCSACVRAIGHLFRMILHDRSRWLSCLPVWSLNRFRYRALSGCRTFYYTAFFVLYPFDSDDD